MIIPHSYAGKRVYIFGLGKTGLAVAAALIAAGATTTGSLRVRRLPPLGILWATERPLIGKP
jgi:cation diffusion facilitator CzcD-associated flavoprotein CzcO